jgi:hypothetical protein
MNSSATRYVGDGYGYCFIDGYGYGEGYGDGYGDGYGEGNGYCYGYAPGQIAIGGYGGGYGNYDGDGYGHGGHGANGCGGDAYIADAVSTAISFLEKLD